MSSGTGSNYPAQVVANESSGVNQAFQPFPYPNTTQAANNAYSGIANDVYPAGQTALQSGGLNAIQYGQNFPGMLQGAEQSALGAGQTALGYGQNAANAGQTALGYGQQAANTATGAILGGQMGLTNAGNLSNWLNNSLGTASQAGWDQYSTLAPYVTQALQQGFDPQNALYNQQYNLQQQQNLASQAMNGVGQSPYAAGLTAQGDQNFNIAWQASQLQREAQAAQTASGLSSTAMGDLTSGLNTDLGIAQGSSNILSQGVGDYLSGLSTAQNAYQTGISGVNADIAGQLAGISGVNSDISALGQYGSLMGLGVSGMEGLLGAGGNALTQATGMNAQQVAQYLAYLQGSTNNASAATGQQINALNSGTSLYGATNQGNLAQQQQLSNALGGIGQLGGTLGGAYLNSSALNNIANNL